MGNARALLTRPFSMCTDSGAEAYVVTAVFRDRVFNVRALDAPVVLDTANGEKTLGSQCDLVICQLLITGAHLTDVQEQLRLVHEPDLPLPVHVQEHARPVLARGD